MKDDMSFDPVPIDEEVESLGPDYDQVKARQQAVRMIELLEKKFGKGNYHNKLKIKSNPHEFGSYYDIECRFDDTDEESLDYCLCIESNYPNTWDDDNKIDCKDWKNGPEIGPAAEDQEDED